MPLDPAVAARSGRWRDRLNWRGWLLDDHYALAFNDTRLLRHRLLHDRLTFDDGLLLHDRLFAHDFACPRVAPCHRCRDYCERCDFP
jgi:hypothetical protein